MWIQWSISFKSFWRLCDSNFPLRVSRWPCANSINSSYFEQSSFTFSSNWSVSAGRKSSDSDSYSDDSLTFLVFNFLSIGCQYSVADSQSELRIKTDLILLFEHQAVQYLFQSSHVEKLFLYQCSDKIQNLTLNDLSLQILTLTHLTLISFNGFRYHCKCLKCRKRTFISIFHQIPYFWWQTYSAENL